VLVGDGESAPTGVIGDGSAAAQQGAVPAPVAGAGWVEEPDAGGRRTFTVSNLGMYGVEQFAAVINPPDAAILA
jgi:pyruvate dehydrogenase E2 component (dihydrolipoamide acetyltransferase)